MPPASYWRRARPLPPTADDPIEVVYGTTASVTVTNIPGEVPPARTLVGATVFFASPAGNDDQGKDHDTTMAVSLLNNSGTQVASYIESDDTPPGLGTDFPQGYAPNSNVPRKMKLQSNPTEMETSLAVLSIYWKPDPRIDVGGKGSDLWKVGVSVSLQWNTGEETMTKPVHYELGKREGTTSAAIQY